MSLDDNLSRKLAAYRTALISDVRYEVELNFNQKSASYNGLTTIFFNLKDSAEIAIDFISRDLARLTVNGKEINKPKFERWQITLPKTLLKEGQNSVRVEYVNDFDTNGTGLHRFVEKESGLEYIFSDLEPFECHKIFPCFDQPDLKAIFRLKVSSPKSWVILSNTSVESTHEEISKKCIKFSATKPLSTYVFCIVGGNFEIKTSGHSELPMNIIYRKSMEAFIPFEEIFSWTIEAKQHFESYLGIPYPYDKYDQAFVPEFDGGAMENAGLVTFTERYLSRGKPTAGETFELAGTVVHELAHMWFGNLVTMKWWDGLWLNESFATYFGYYILGKLESFEDWGLYFSQEVKNRAFEQDQSCTTHPIVFHCEDTNSAFASFDAITYEKAASIVHQLIYQLSEESFRAGINQYLTHHAHGVTELDDLLRALQSHTSIDLKTWSDQWLRSENLNTVEPSWQENDGLIRRFILKQTAPDSSPVLRDHHTRIALYGEPTNEDAQLLPYRVLDIQYSGELTEIPELVDQPAPFFVYCNHSDFDYVKTNLDTKSLKYLRSVYPRLAEDLTRQLVANSLWNMVLDIKISPLDYIDLAMEFEETEPNKIIAVFLLNTLRQAMLRFVPIQYRGSILAKLFSRSWARITDKNLNYERKCVWYSILIHSISSNKQCEDLIQALKQGCIESFELDLDQRWRLTRHLAYYRHVQAPSIVDEMQQLDPGDLGIKYALEATSALRRDKKTLFGEILNSKEISSDLSRAKMQSLFHPLQANECEELVPDYFTQLRHVFLERDKIFSRDFSKLLYPFPFKHQARDLTIQLLQDQDSIPFLMVRSLKENLEEVLRCLKIEETFFSLTKGGEQNFSMDSSRR